MIEFDMSKNTNESDQLDLLGGLDQSALPRNNSSLEEDELLVDHSNKQSSSMDMLKCPEMLLIVDTETTGLDFDLDNCIEVGAILFNVPNRSILAQQSFLMPSLNNKAEKINKIPSKITKLNQPLQEAINYLQALINSSDVLVAHNASFDRRWFGKNPLPAVSKPWLCSMEEIKWPSDRNLRPRPSVRDLALAYEVPVWSAHRALSDCIYIAEVFRRCVHLEDLLTKGLEPRSLMKAQVSYSQRHLAREAGFRWNDPIEGAWSRRLSAREIDELSFPVVSLE